MLSCIVALLVACSGVNAEIDCPAVTPSISVEAPASAAEVIPAAPATRMASGLRVHVDPLTGTPVVPSPEESRGFELSPAFEQAFRTSDRIDVMSGTSVFKGTRVPVQALLDHLEAGDSLNVFLEDFPSVTRQQAIDFLEPTPRSGRP